MTKKHGMLLYKAFNPITKIRKKNVKFIFFINFTLLREQNVHF